MSEEEVAWAIPYGCVPDNDSVLDEIAAGTASPFDFVDCECSHCGHKLIDERKCPKCHRRIIYDESMVCFP